MAITYRDVILALIGMAVGLMLGFSMGRNITAAAVCAESGFTDHEIMPDGEIRCFSVLTLEE